jgi:acetyl esterase/lipase
MRFAAIALFAVFGIVPAEVQHDRDVVYGKASGQELKLNLARPKKAKGTLPCVVILAGGGWKGKGRQDPIIEEIALGFARRGYVAATVDTRSTPEHRFPAQVEDAKCAVRFLRANARKYRVDPQRIGSVGFSAGGHLALMLGAMATEDGMEGDGGWGDQPSQVNAVVSFYGPTNFTTSGGDFAFFLGAKREDDPALYRTASPITYVKKGTAPILLIHGMMDDMVPWTQATEMAAALTAAGVPGRVELLLGAGHRWGGAEWNRTLEEACAFMDQQLRSPARK